MSSVPNLCVLARKSGRVLDELANLIATDSSLAERSRVLDCIVDALSRVHDALDILYQEFPEEACHFDPKLPPTVFMQEISNLISESKAFVKNGDIEEARLRLVLALRREPPSMVWESIQKQLSDL